MSIINLFITIVAVLISFSSFAIEKGIYGYDDRIDMYQASPYWQDKARSVATLIHNDSIVFKPTKSYHKIYKSTLVESMKVCEDQPFALQPDNGECSGFLVADDILVTASHCLRFEASCKNYKWIFDFGKFSEDDDLQKIPHENFYGCKEIIERYKGPDLAYEYLIVRLDRKVVDREPLQIRTEGFIADGESLAIIGSPSGLPLKYASGGFVRDNSSPYFFVTNLDSFGGNSGSPVFNLNTGLVEGLLTRGDTDYVFNEARRCREVVRCSMDGCSGEGVTRISLLLASLRHLLP